MEHIIPIASDHGGFEMKEFLIGKLKEAGYMVKDFGTYSNESVDYPDMIHPLAMDIEHGKYPLGIILCLQPSNMGNILWESFFAAAAMVLR